MGTFLVAAAIVVSAASSLTDVLNELAKRYEGATGQRVLVNAGASNTLARQIVEGAPVDLFISADESQMDLVERASRLVPNSRTPLLQNRLVVIVPTNSTAQVREPQDVASALLKRIAIANPQGVPAGVYARAWLEQIGLWATVERKMVPLPTVRAALVAVREGRADAGIVYATDARTEPRVRVAFEPAAREVPAIVYPAAVIRGSRQTEAARFLAYLGSKEAMAVFEAAGFARPDEF